MEVCREQIGRSIVRIAAKVLIKPLQTDIGIQTVTRRKRVVARVVLRAQTDSIQFDVARQSRRQQCAPTHIRSDFGINHCQRRAQKKFALTQPIPPVEVSEHSLVVKGQTLRQTGRIKNPG